MAMTLEDAERVFGRSHGRLKHRDLEVGAVSRPSTRGLSGWLPVAAAAAVGVIGGVAVFSGRRLASQAAHALPGDWLGQLLAERRVADALLQAGEQTREDEPQRRHLVLARVAYLLLRQSLQKEGAIYPAMLEDGNGGVARRFAADQFDIKASLYALWEGDRCDPSWSRMWRALRQQVEALRVEEDKVMAGVHARLTPKANARLTRAMNREGDRLA